MKKIINKILIASMAVSMLSTTVFAYDLNLSDHVSITNVVSEDNRIFALDDEKNAIQTYTASGVVNVIATTTGLEELSVKQILPIDGRWTPSTEVPFEYGGIMADQTYALYSIVSLTEPGLYYVTTQKDGITQESVIFIDKGLNYKSNAYQAELTTQEVTVDGTEIAVDTFEVDGVVYIKIRDIAQMLVDTQHEFEITWDDTFELIDIYTNMDYTSTGAELVEKSYETSQMIAYDTAPDLFKERSSTKVYGYVIDGENCYDIETLAQKLDFSIQVNSAENYIAIDTTAQY